MHEFAICGSVVEATLDAWRKLEQPAARVRRVRVVIGRMHQIVPDNLQMAFEVLTRDTPAAGAVLETIYVAVQAVCGSCGWRGEIAQPFFLCGSCQSGDLRLERGKELYLDQLEVEEP